MSRPPAAPPRSRPQVELRNNLPTCRQSSRKASEVCGWSLALIEEFNPSPQGDGDVSERRKDGRFHPTGARGGGSWHGQLRPPRRPGSSAGGSGRRLPLRWGRGAAAASGAWAHRAGGRSCWECLGQARGKATRRSTDRDTTAAAPGRWQRGSGSRQRRTSHPGPGSLYGIRGYCGALPQASCSPPLPHFAAPWGCPPPRWALPGGRGAGCPGGGSLHGHPGPAAPPQPRPPCSGPLPAVPARLRQGRAALSAAKQRQPLPGRPGPAPPRPCALT